MEYCTTITNWWGLECLYHVGRFDCLLNHSECFILMQTNLPVGTESPCPAYKFEKNVGFCIKSAHENTLHCLY